jgi:hypothetical protein
VYTCDLGGNCQYQVEYAYTSAFPNNIQLKSKKVSKSTREYIDTCKQAYENMKLISNVEILGKTWNDLSQVERELLVGQMIIWDKPTLNIITLSYLHRSTNIAGGIIYGLEDIFPEE